MGNRLQIHKENFFKLSNTAGQITDFPVLPLDNISKRFRSYLQELEHHQIDYQLEPSLNELFSAIESFSPNLSSSDYLRALGAICNHAFIGPKRILISPNMNCNIHCLYCNLHGPDRDSFRSNHLESRGWKPNEHMDIEKLTSLLKDASQTGVEELCIVGSGEPTLYPYYRQAIAQAKELRLRVNLSTNGVLLNEELCDFLIEQNVDHITISFSGPSLKSWQDNHPLSNKTQYKKVLQNIELLSRKKRQSGSISPNLEILHVIHKHSYDQMLPMITQCRQLGADAVWFQLLHCFDFNSHLAMDEEQILELKRYYEEALLLANNLDIKVNQNLKYQINRLKNDGTWATDLFEKTGCLVGWIFCYINVAFEVNFCCGVKSMAALEQSFSSLWNSSLYKQWRTCARNFDLKNSPTGIHGKSLLDTFCKSCDNLNFQFEMLGLIERAGLKEFYRTYQ